MLNVEVCHFPPPLIVPPLALLAGLQAEGIYRVSGKKEDVLSLQDKFDEGKEHTLCV